MDPPSRVPDLPVERDHETYQAPCKTGPTAQTEDWPESDDEDQIDNSAAPSGGSGSSSTFSVDERADLRYQVGEHEFRAASHSAPQVIPSDSKTFARYFPSDHRIVIQHDDTTRDGNMNLRCYTFVPGRRNTGRALNLFHLRMHSLKRREFSLRRYCRDSGREVCHTGRAQKSPTGQGQAPNFYRSLSHALASLRRQRFDEGEELHNHGSRPWHQATPDARNEQLEHDASDDRVQKKAKRMSTNTIRLDFSNYAHVNITSKKQGLKQNYTFEYWGVQYTWRKQVQQDDSGPTVSYQLVNDSGKWPLAYIVPDILTPYQRLEEQARGGWVPQCSLWIKDAELIRNRSDVAEVVVATGLMALVDDSINRIWPRKAKSSTKLLDLLSPLSIGSSSAPPSARMSSASSKTTSRPTSSRQPSSASSNRTRTIMDAVLRPQMLHRRQHTVPVHDAAALQRHQDVYVPAAVAAAVEVQPYGHYRRRTTT